MKKATNKDDFIKKFSNEELLTELKKRDNQGSYQVKKLKNISSETKVKVFDSLYKYYLSSLKDAAKEKYMREDTFQYFAEETLTKLFGKDVFKECINKIQNGADITIEDVE